MKPAPVRKAKIFVADLIHNQRVYTYCAPLNVGCLAATLAKSCGSAVETALFKFPDALIEALEERPDVLALSNYDWNVNLNRAVIQIARAANPDIFVVMGGPNIRRGSAGAESLLVSRTDVDAYVLNEGEEAFSGLVQFLLGTQGGFRTALKRSGAALPQVAYLSAAATVVIGADCPTASMSPIPHPSAWLGGYMDQFLDVRSFPLAPILETTRGCPYTCTFCTAWGTAATGAKSIRQYPLDVVFEELRYIFRKSTQPFYLFVGDANMGILERDLVIAEEIRRLADQHRNVIGIGLDSSKNMVKRNIEIYRILGDLSLPNFAQQTFNIDVSEKIGRRNVPLETAQDLVKTVHANGSRISTDLLVGLPTEDRQRHIDSIKQAYACGFDRIQVSDIRLLKGTEMEEDYQREMYGLKSKVRIIPNAFGEYAGRRVIDYEHCVRETLCMTESDLLGLRLFHAHVFIVLNLEMGRPLAGFADRHGFDAIDMLAAISQPPPARFPHLATYFDRYLEQARGEWFENEAAADAHYFQDDVFAGILKDGFPKLNYAYAARLVLDPMLKRDFFGWMSETIASQLPRVSRSIVDEVTVFSLNRIASAPFQDDRPVVGLSPIAAAELAGFLDVPGGPPTEKIHVELRLEPKHLDLLQKSVAQYGASDSLDLAVQLALQYSNKALVRDARVVEVRPAVREAVSGGSPIHCR
ncbi:MAG: radical SAM protein [Acidobacteriota bacterium]